MLLSLVLKILVACEFSGIVRDAFRGKGHDAISCDFLPTEREGPHIQGDVTAILSHKWDMMYCRCDGRAVGLDED